MLEINTTAQSGTGATINKPIIRSKAKVKNRGGSKKVVEAIEIPIELIRAIQTQILCKSPATRSCWYRICGPVGNS